MNDVGIEYQTVLGCPPVEFVHLAADLGCRAISMKASTMKGAAVQPLQPVRVRRLLLPRR